MTILVSVKINDGVVLATDSASSYASGMIYNNSRKIVNLREGFPIGAMATGAGGIGNESIDTLLKDLRRRFSGMDPAHADWELDPGSYRMADVAARLREFLFEEKSRPGAIMTSTKLRVCGYSAGRPLAEIWEVKLAGNECGPPSLVQGEQDFGLRWDGEYEVLDRLVFGLATGFDASAVKHGMDAAQVSDLRQKLVPDLYELLFVEAMPIQDAIGLARYLVETTIGFIQYSVLRPKTVGGPVEIAAITKHEGFQWVQRREALA